MDDACLDHVVSRTLDNMGLDEEQVQWRRDMWLGYEFIKGRIPVPFVNAWYVTGSSVEGVGLLVLQSDLDVMFVCDRFEVITGVNEWNLNPRQVVVLIDTSEVHPGYAHLVVMSNTSAIPLGSNHSTDAPQYFFLSPSGKVLLLNGTVKSSGHTSYSPAYSSLERGGPTDKVTCLFCKNLPLVLLEFLSRHRPKNCPPPDLVERLRQMGCLLVSTACKTSLMPFVEWRLSFSLFERELVWRWPLKQLKCYVLLKLAKDIINRYSQDKIHSYHMKTLMFWMTEEEGEEWWCSHTLLDGFMYSLQKLLDCVENGSCPNYFIKSNNMMDMFLSQERYKISRIIKDMISIGPKCLLQSKLFRKFFNVTHCIMFCPEDDPPISMFKRDLKDTKYLQQGMIIVNVIVQFLRTIEKTTDFGCSSNAAIERISSNVLRLQRHHEAEQSFVKKKLLNIQINLLMNTLGSIVSSAAVATHMGNRKRHVLIRCAENLLFPSISTDITSGKLKLAVHFYRMGKIERASCLLDSILSCYGDGILPVGVFSERVYNVKQLAKLSDATIASFEPWMRRCVALDTMFSLSEIGNLPRAMAYEIMKSFLRMPNQPGDVKYQYTCAVDSKVLIQFLQFLCYYKLQRDMECHRVLENLRLATENQAGTNYLPIALNLLGSCYKEIGETRKAMTCFVRSLRMKPDCSAAPLHIVSVLHKYFTLQRCSDT